MHLLNNKNHLRRKNVQRKKEVAKHKLIVFKCIFRKNEDIVKFSLLKILFNKNMLQINIAEIMSGLYKRKRYVALITIVNKIIDLVDDEPNEKRVLLNLPR